MRATDSSGFSLVELLVAIGIILLVAAFGVPVLQRVLAAGDRTKALANMRSIGHGIHLYAADRGGTLPGPLWPGQLPEFDPAREGRLVRELASYLDIPTPAAPRVVDLFVPPAYRQAMGRGALATARTYVMNMDVGTATAPLAPWGSLTMQPSLPPCRLSEIPPGVWGFSDADRLHPRVAGASWKSQTPPVKIHGARRLAWFFNGSVGTLEDGELEPPR